MVGVTRVWQSEESQITITQGVLKEYVRRRGSVEKCSMLKFCLINS